MLYRPGARGGGQGVDTSFQGRCVHAALPNAIPVGGCRIPPSRMKTPATPSKTPSEVGRGWSPRAQLRSAHAVVEKYGLAESRAARIAYLSQLLMPPLMIEMTPGKFAVLIWLIVWSTAAATAQDCANPVKVCPLTSDTLDYTQGSPVAVPGDFCFDAAPNAVFYTFQTMSYTIDVYRGYSKAEKNLGYFALYVSYFPQLVAGPIERAKRLLPQIKKDNKVDITDIQFGLNKIAYGFFKKVVVADNVSMYVNSVYANLESHTGPTIFFANLLFFIVCIVISRDTAISPLEQQGSWEFD